MLIRILRCGLAFSTMVTLASSTAQGPIAAASVSPGTGTAPNGGDQQAATQPVAQAVVAPAPETSTEAPSKQSDTSTISSTENPYTSTSGVTSNTSTELTTTLTTGATSTARQSSTAAFNSTLFVDDLLDLLRKELEINATINTILDPFEITAEDDDVTDTNFSANVFRGYYMGFDSVARKDRCSHRNTVENVTVQCLLTFRALKSISYSSVKEEEKALVTVSTTVEDVIFLMDFQGPHNQPARLQKFKSVLDPTVKPQIVEGSVRSKWVSEFKSQIGTNVGMQLMKILYRDFKEIMDTVLSRVNLPT